MQNAIDLGKQVDDHIGSQFARKRCTTVIDTASTEPQNVQMSVFAFRSNVGVATCTATGSMSQAKTSRAPRSRDAIARMPEPVPRSSTTCVWFHPSLQGFDRQLRRFVGPGPERLAGIDADRQTIVGTRIIPNWESRRSRSPIGKLVYDFFHSSVQSHSSTTVLEIVGRAHRASSKHVANASFDVSRLELELK